MPDIDKPVDAAPIADNPQVEPTFLDEPAYSDKVLPAGTEENVNVIADDSVESDVAKNQEPELDDEDDSDETDSEDFDPTADAVEGA